MDQNGDCRISKDEFVSYFGGKLPEDKTLFNLTAGVVGKMLQNSKSCVPTPARCADSCKNSRRIRVSIKAAQASIHVGCRFTPIASSTHKVYSVSAKLKY